MLPLLLATLFQPALADDYGTGKGIALAGFGLGVGGSLVTVGATLSLIPSADPETGMVDPDAARRVRPANIAGGSIRRVGGALMGFGTLRMHAANRKAGAEASRTFGLLSVGFGLGSLATFGAAQFFVGTPDEVGTEAALTGLSLSAISGGLIAASFSTGFVQFVMNNTNKPAKRRKIEAARLEWGLAPTSNGLVVTGRF